MKHRAGFTLIELLIVVLIIIILGMLAAAAIPRFIGAVESAKAAEMIRFVGQAREQLNNWAATHNGVYTNNFSHLGFAAGGGVELDDDETVATLKYWTVTIDVPNETIIADRTGEPDTSDIATLTIAGMWGGDYWNKPGHPPIPAE